MFAAKSSAWHVPFTPTYLCKLQYFSCGRDTEKRLITIALVESAIPAKIHGGDPRNICPVVARLRFHFPSSPRPTSFFLFFSSSFSFLFFFLFHVQFSMEEYTFKKVWKSYRIRKQCDISVLFGTECNDGLINLICHNSNRYMQYFVSSVSQRLTGTSSLVEFHRYLLASSRCHLLN